MERFTEQVNRRDFLKLATFGLGAVATACLRDDKSQEESVIRRAEGKWTKEEVKSLAKSMMAEKEFKLIADAGQILFVNQEGEPSFSKVSPLFIDRPVQLITKASLPSYREDHGVTMKMHINEVGPEVRVSLDSKTNNEKLELINRKNLAFESIEISAGDFEDKSNFLIKFAVAKEVYSIKAFDMVANYLDSVSAYQAPTDPELQNAFRLFNLYTLKMTKYSIMPASFMADWWGYFIMIPDFNRARNKGKFTKEDEESLFLFEGLSRYFLAEGILMTKDGDYQWTTDSQRFYDSWVEADARTHAAYQGVPPPVSPLWLPKAG